MTLKEFREYISSELGIEYPTDRQLLELRFELDGFMKELKSGDFRLLPLDSFIDSYGENSILLITKIDCESVFDIALYRDLDSFSNDMFRYGTFKADIETEEKNGFRRIRVIEYQGKKYLHHMFNGEIIDIYEV